MTADTTTPRQAALELWGGVECTVNRVGDAYNDQSELTGYARRPEDDARIAALGIRTLRFPVLWERVAPDGLPSADWGWTDARLAGLRTHGITPIAGLVHHGSGPRYTSLLDDGFPAALAEYAAAVARRYPWIAAYTPVNEPLTTARFSALYGHWYPHAAADATFIRALLNECRGTVLAMRAVREINPAATLVQTDDVGKTFSSRLLTYQARFENHRRWLGWDLLCGRVGRHHPLWKYLLRHGATVQELAWFAENPCPPDIVGLNYYLTSDRYLDEHAAPYPPAYAGGNGRHAYADVEAVRACRSISGHRAVLEEAWHRYGLPVALTEVHLGCSREEQMRWLVEAWNGAHSARRAGADVRAVTVWALFGLSDWDTLVTRLNGHYEPGTYDVRSPEPRATALAGIVRDLVAGREPEHPVVAAPGWWRREGRLWHLARASYPTNFPPPASSMRTRSRVAEPRPVVVLGARGTLGAAFARVCESRGLSYEALGRGEVDLLDPAKVSGVFDQLRPWAVVNAAGYVRVDQAESEPEQCLRVNTEAAARVAELCAARGTRLVTFSSDLVFDGALTRPYVESDPVNPLNVYGRSKAAAEAAVLAAFPDALVVRTSAFFGPWDEWNIVHLALLEIAEGQVWRAAARQRVSPTYVPDLVNASLDLLIDGGSGLWHLANVGDVSWAELVRQAAALAGLSPDLVEEAPPDVVLPAPRPAYSVLGSERARIMPSLEDGLRRFIERREALSGQHRRGTAA